MLLMSMSLVLLVLLVLCISVLSLIRILAISSYLSLSHSCLPRLHLSLVFLCSVIYSVQCLDIVFLSPFQHVEDFICNPFFFLSLVFQGMISIADVIKTPLKVPNSCFTSRVVDCICF